MAPSCRVIDPVLQRSLCVWETLRATSEPHTLADVVPPLFASLADFARLSDFQCHLVTNTEVLHIRAYANNHTCRFVAERERFLYDYVAVTVVLVVMEI